MSARIDQPQEIYLRFSMSSQESLAHQGVCCSSILMATQGVVVHGS
jgi:hypothetical protein